MERKSLGFTLMELLIVIGVLGILAAGLLAAIDPFEQLKKARDANNRNATIEMLSALTRYYANHGAFPWRMGTPVLECNDVSLPGIDAFADAGGYSTSSQAFRACIVATVGEDKEIKDTFFTGLGETNIYVGQSSSDTSDLSVCFIPESRSARNDASTNYMFGGTSTSSSESDILIQIDPNFGEAAEVCPAKSNDTYAGKCLQCFE